MSRDGKGRGRARLVPGLLVLAAAAHLVGAAPVLPAPRGQGGAASAELVVEATRGRLSVALEQAPLEAVLDAIGRETGVVVRAYGPLAKAVSDRFRGLSVETALRRLLRTFNVAFVYAARGGELAEVLIYPATRDGASNAAAGSSPQRSARLAPGTPDRTGPGTGLRAAPAGPGRLAPPGERSASRAAQDVEPPLGADGLPPAAARRLADLQAAGAVAATGGEAARQAVARDLGGFLADADPNVRRRALEVAEDTRVLSAAELREAALTDAEVQVRWAALAALVATAGREAAVAAARDGLRDPMPSVRLAALEALGEQLGGEAGEAAARAALVDADAAVRAKAQELVAIIEEGNQLAAEEEADEHDVEADESEAPEETQIGQSG